MARTRPGARKSTGGKAPRRNFYERARRVASARRLYTPSVPNTFLVPAVDPYHIRVQHRESEMNQNDYQPLDGPDSDESEEDTSQHSQSSQMTDKSPDNSATGDGHILSQELIRNLDAKYIILKISLIHKS